jgi:hypothetical protein
MFQRDLPKVILAYLLGGKLNGALNIIRCKYIPNLAGFTSMVEVTNLSRTSSSYLNTNTGESPWTFPTAQIALPTLSPPILSPGLPQRAQSVQRKSVGAMPVPSSQTAVINEEKEVVPEHMISSVPKYDIHPNSTAPSALDNEQLNTSNYPAVTAHLFAQPKHQ